MTDSIFSSDGYNSASEAGSKQSSTHRSRPSANVRWKLRRFARVARERRRHDMIAGEKLKLWKVARPGLQALEVSQPEADAQAAEQAGQADDRQGKDH